MLRLTTVVALLAGAAAGCSTECPTPGAVGSVRPPNGKERGDCVAPTGGPAGAGIGACDPGLVCLSNVCVRPPPADCQVVAEQFTSFDLGNYAEPEQRAPLVGKYKAACEKALVSKEQGACMAQAHDAFAAKQCAPAMFPELSAPAAGGNACANAIAVEKNLMIGQFPQNDANSKMMVDEIMKAMQDSCEQDKWPPQLVACMASAKNITDFGTCNNLMPPDVAKKMADRVQAASQAITARMTRGYTPPSPAPSE